MICRLIEGRIQCLEWKQDVPKVYFTNHLKIEQVKETLTRPKIQASAVIGVFEPEDKLSIHINKINMLKNLANSLLLVNKVTGFEINNERIFLKKCLLEKDKIHLNNVRFK